MTRGRSITQSPLVGLSLLIPAAANEVNDGTLEAWIVPPGAALPDPYAQDEIMEDDTAMEVEGK
jgi:hypothetical protein